MAFIRVSITALHFALKKRNVGCLTRCLMGTHYCAVCSEPVDLTVDRCDETGDPVHEQCYFGRITAKSDTAIPVSGKNIIHARQMRVIAATRVRTHAAFVDASVRTRAEGAR